jgi:CBS domain-containing protein
MTREPACVSPTQQVADAVEIMKSQDCGVVPVVDSKSGGSLVGIITDRDIALRACCDGGSGPGTTIAEVMTTNLFCVAPEDSIERVRQVMTEGGVRRVPVVENDRLVGIISMKDLSDESSARVVGETDESIMGQEPNN